MLNAVFSQYCHGEKKLSPCGCSPHAGLELLFFFIHGTCDKNVFSDCYTIAISYTIVKRNPSIWIKIGTVFYGRWSDDYVFGFFQKTRISYFFDNILLNSLTFKRTRIRFVKFKVFNKTYVHETPRKVVHKYHPVNGGNKSVRLFPQFRLAIR